MSEAAAIKEIVACYRVLAEAISTYERALFYYDESRNPQKHVNTKLTYDEFVNAFPPKPAGAPPGHYLVILFLYKRWLTLNIITIYAEAAKALASRYATVVKLHEDLAADVSKNRLPFIKLGRRVPLADRNSAYGAAITEQHFAKFNELLRDLDQKILQSTQHKWCAYTIEFSLLREKCILAIDEISFLCRRVDDLQAIAHQKRNEIIALVSVVLAVGAIGIGTYWDGRSYHVSKASYNLAKQEAQAKPPVMQRDDSIAIELGKLSERSSRLERMIEQIAIPPVALKDDIHQALLAEIKALRDAILAGNATTASQIKDALAATEQRLNDALSKLKPQEKPEPSEPAKDNQPLLDELKAIKDSIAVLKIAIETRPPPTIIIQDTSKRKHGLFNWF